MADIRTLCAQIIELWDADCDIDQEINQLRGLLAESPQPADGEVAELVASIERMSIEADAAMQLSDSEVLGRAANLLERLSPPQPIPVSERLPGPGDCLDEGWAWFFNPRTGWRQATQPVHSTYTHWLPAHALPVPNHTSEND